MISFAKYVSRNAKLENDIQPQLSNALLEKAQIHLLHSKVSVEFKISSQSIAEILPLGYHSGFVWLPL